MLGVRAYGGEEDVGLLGESVEFSLEIDASGFNLWRMYQSLKLLGTCVV
jgi:hypothetical protein